MVVVGLAHAAELAAKREYERALARVSALDVEARNLETSCNPNAWNMRRWHTALAALRAARDAFHAAQERHSRLYRAYLRRYVEGTPRLRGRR